MNREEFYEALSSSREKVLLHHGIKGQKWGVRRYQNSDGTYTAEGKNRRNTRLFVSGSSKTQDSSSPYYRELPEPVKDFLKPYLNKKASILIGDAPGVDRQVQDWLKEQGYKKVTVYGPGKEIRYQADSKWKSKLYDSKYEVGSKEWLAKKDKAMSRSATEGLAITLDEGSSATKENIKRLESKKKPVKNYQLSAKGNQDDRWVIQHSGVKGQKWGDRKYRNPDGTLTEEGKKRYNYYKSSEEKKAAKKVSKVVARMGPKSVKEVSKDTSKPAKNMDEWIEEPDFTKKDREILKGTVKAFKTAFKTGRTIVKGGKKVAKGAIKTVGFVTKPLRNKAGKAAAGKLIEKDRKAITNLAKAIAKKGLPLL